jgi:PKD repeat protein
MKTITTKISVFCLIFLFYSKTKAQEEVYAYRGGNADGFATETLENATCSTPFHHYAYFGGTGDGAATESLENATCSTPFHQYAYFGGSGDGSASESLENNNCSTPYHFFAYFGGNADGFAVNKTENICPVNPPVADFISDKTEVCVGQSVKFTDTSTNMPTGWTWTFEGGSPATASTKIATVTYNTPGVYQVKLVAANYNGSDTITKMGYITVKSTADCATMGTSNANAEKIQIYPNPTKNILYIKSPNEIKNIEIFDVAGRKVMNTNVSSKQKETQVNLEKLNSGVYILKTYTSSGLETFKVIKKD